MGTYHIKGKRKLSGEVNISGAKNAALPILAASVISGQESMFEACPDISDVDNMLKILSKLGCRINKTEDFISVDSRFLSEYEIPDELMKEMRSSVFLAGALIARCGRAVISSPGGCRIGKRPIDIHLKGLKLLGADVRQQDGKMMIDASHLKGGEIKLDYPSVGATENLMLAAMKANGDTIISNCAREPEIVDLQSYINACGGEISGAGTDTICIRGGKKLGGCSHRIIPDRIEAGTYLIMSMATGGEVVLRGINHSYISSVTDILERAGAKIVFYENCIYASRADMRNINEKISTAPYPGFPTDIQPQMVSLLSCCGEGSIMEENIFENRLGYASELVKMEADIEISGKQVIIKRNADLCGARVNAEDLRGGAALVIAGLAADGDTYISNTGYIKRGYSRLEEKIRLLGGKIEEDAQE